MPTTRWQRIARLADLPEDRGVAVLIDDEPIALYHLAGGSVFAVSHIDPKTAMPVMARGLIGSKDQQVFVASPLHKERYDLRTGQCLDDDSLHLRVYALQVDDGDVLLRVDS